MNGSSRFTMGLPLFRSEAQFRVLGEVFAVPGRELGVSDLAVRGGLPHPTVSREVSRLAVAGLVRTRRDGRRTLVAAATDSPVFDELRSLLGKTYGPLAVLCEEFADVDGELILFGSFAARWRGDPGPVPNDIDVLVVTAATATQVWDAAARASQRIGLDVTPVLRTPDEWASDDSGFARSIRESPTIRLKTDPVGRATATAGPVADEGRWG